LCTLQYSYDLTTARCIKAGLFYAIFSTDTFIVSFPGQNAEERAKKYSPQLVAYKEAMEKATGKPIIDMLLHLPVNGLILKVKQRGEIINFSVI